jgi:hypothetical protein
MAHGDREEAVGMTRLQDVQDTVVDFLGLKPKSRLQRLMDIDVRDYVPSRQDIIGMIPGRRRQGVDLDITSLVVGMVIGVGIGVGVTVAMNSRQVQPTIKRARKQVKVALERAQEEAQNLPSRLNITRMEEQTTR